MRHFLHRLALAAVLGIGLAGAALKVAPAADPQSPKSLFHPNIAEPAGTAALSNRGPYAVTRYVARRCLGEIFVLPLHRNGEAADLLPGVKGFVLDGRITAEFPAMAYTVARVMAFAHLRKAEPQVVAFRETGSCNLALRIGAAPSG